MRDVKETIHYADGCIFPKILFSLGNRNKDMSARICARAGVCVLDGVVITHFLKTQRGLAAMFFAHSVTRP